MMNRALRTTSLASREELADAVQTLFVGELLAPSRPLYLVQAWVSDVPILDNRAGRFADLLPGMPRTTLHLADLICYQLGRGGSCVIACRPEPSNEQFITVLHGRIGSGLLLERLNVVESEELHEKGILTDRILMSGSMNLTNNGLIRLEEVVTVTSDRNVLQRTRNDYIDRWGPSER